MEKKILCIVITVIFLLIFLMLLFYVYYEKDEISINIDDFKDLALEVNCADKTNDLFIIDNKMVLWVVEGNCSDASFSYTLFGNNTDIILCKEFDTIAGPKRECFNNDYKDIFQTIIENINNNNFGLGLNHKVEKILL
jgi:uncharacterized protein YpmB